VSSADTVPFTQQSLNRTSLDDLRLLSGDFWRDLRVFLAVAKAGSFSRAAEILASSQPTVSRQVRRLQDLMGAQLMVASQNGIKLTVKGEQLARSLAALDQSLFSMAIDLKADKSEAGLVRVSVTDGLGVFFVVPSIKMFSAYHPLVQIALQSPLNLNDLRQNQTDMMIGFAPVKASDVVCRPARIPLPGRAAPDSARRAGGSAIDAGSRRPAAGRAARTARNPGLAGL
jgi:DNA-binding transcriptional LysR family regulator